MVRLFSRKSPSKPKAKSKPRPAQTLAEIGRIRGEIKYPWGTIPHATVRAGNRLAISDGAGKYEIPGLDPGVYSVSVDPPFPGYEAEAQNVTVVGGETKAVDFYLDFEKVVIDGHVYGRDSKPIVGATVSGVMCGKDIRGETTVTDEIGYFKFERASPGSQFIRVNAAGYMSQTRDFAAKKGENMQLEFHLTPASCKVHGTVVDEKGRPLGAEVFLSSELGAILDKRKSNTETGYYEFAVLPGTYNLLANATEYLSKGWRGQISADTKVDLKLSSMRPESLADGT